MAGSRTAVSSPKPRRSSRLASLESTESPQPTSPQPSRAKRARAAADDDDALGADFFATVDFDGLTPPRKAAKALADLLTMSAVRVVLDQMSGTRHRSPMAPKLIDYLHAKPLRADASAWLAELMAHEELDYRLVAVRIIETRKVLACDAEGFDYDWMKAEAIDGTREDNLTLRRAMLTGALEAGDRDSSGDRDS